MTTSFVEVILHIHCESMAGPPPRGMDPRFAHGEHLRMDPPCCFECDEGGTVLFCDGPCGRHFHYVIDGQEPNEFDGHGPACRPVTIPKDHDLDAVWLCELCQHDKGRCFACGLLGRTVTPTTNEPLVIQCAHPDCYSFYHIGCLRTVLRMGQLPYSGCPENTSGHPAALICSRHYCDFCKEYREGIWDFVQCRRCPRAWCHDDEPGANKHLTKGVKDRDTWEIDEWRMVYCNRHFIPEGSDLPAHDC